MLTGGSPFFRFWIGVRLEPHQRWPSTQTRANYTVSVPLWQAPTDIRGPSGGRGPAYPGLMPPPLLVLQDDLFFGARVQAAARRLGLEVELVSPREIEARARDEGAVVVMQLTLRPERQL